MEFEVAKTFMRGGTLLRPGDELPEGLDKITLDHYKRHGMVREIKPQEAKPDASKRRTTTPRPKETKQAGPIDNGQLAGQSDPSAGNGPFAGNSNVEGQAGGTVHTSAQDEGESPAAALVNETGPAQPEV